MRIEVRRAKKKQGRWWVIALDGREIYRETTAKDARRFAKGVPELAKGNAFWNEPEPLET